MLKKIVFAVITFFISVIIFQGCVYHKADVEYPFVCDTTNIQYSVEIHAILDAHCKPCHSTTDVSGFNLYDYSTISKLALDGKFTYGTLLSAVMHEGGAPEMPKPDGTPKLQDCDINKIAAWVHSGAPDN